MKTDVVVVGGGPAGASTALSLLQAGLRPIIIEKSRFPRYHIGESMTGECGNCVRKLGLEDEMIARRHPVKWAVSVYGPRGTNRFSVPVRARDSKGQQVDASTWQVRRSDF